MAPPRNPRRRPQSDEDDVPQFGRKKTASLSPVAIIFLFVTPVILGGVFVYLLVQRNAKKEDTQVVEHADNPDHWYDVWKKDVRDAEKMYKKAMEAQRGEDPKEFARQWNKTNDVAVELRDRLDNELKDYKDEYGVLLEDYGGYNEAYKRVDTLLGDLTKSAPFDFDD